MQELLEREPELDGVFVMGDLMAAGALVHLRSTGRRIPQDVSLVSFDDTVIATTTDPQLTTVRQPLGELGALMVDTLIELIREPGSAPRRATLPTTLVERGSA